MKPARLYGAIGFDARGPLQVPRNDPFEKGVGNTNSEHAPLGDAAVCMQMKPTMRHQMYLQQ